VTASLPSGAAGPPRERTRPARAG